jgi:predicted dehydrogenase
MTQPSSPTRIALIGLGMAVTPHAKSLMDLAPRAEVAWAFSRSPERRAAFAARFPFPVTGDLARIAEDRSISAVAILTPPATHLELARRFAESGKHVLLEKPLEVSTERAETLVSLCRDAGVTLAVVLQHRFKPAAERLAELVREGALGALVNASARIPLWRPQSYYDAAGRGTKARDGGGVLLTQGIHTLDLLLSLAGPIAEVCGYAVTSAVHRMETEDLTAAAARYASGAIGIVEATTAAYPGSPERIDLIGTKGSAALVGAALDFSWHDGRREQISADPSPGGAGADPMAFPHDYHRGLWRNFLDAIETGGAPRVTGDEALKVHQLIDALLTASASQSKVAIAGPGT